MGMNPKDTIVFFCNAWCSYLLIKFFKKKKKIDWKFIILFSLLFSTGTGVQFYFIGTLLPIFTYIFINLLLKKNLFKENLFSFFFFLEFFFVFFFLLFFFFQYLFFYYFGPKHILIFFIYQLNFFLKIRL